MSSTPPTILAAITRTLDHDAKATPDWSHPTGTHYVRTPHGKGAIMIVDSAESAALIASFRSDAPILARALREALGDAATFREQAGALQSRLMYERDAAIARAEAAEARLGATVPSEQEVWQHDADTAAAGHKRQRDFCVNGYPLAETQGYAPCPALERAEARLAAVMGQLLRLGAALDSWCGNDPPQLSDSSDPPDIAALVDEAIGAVDHAERAERTLAILHPVMEAVRRMKQAYDEDPNNALYDDDEDVRVLAAYDKAVAGGGGCQEPRCHRDADHIGLHNDGRRAW